MVDGDHRVANRDVAAGDELIYNYNYDKRVGGGTRVVVVVCCERVVAVVQKGQAFLRRKEGPGWRALCPGWKEGGGGEEARHGSNRAARFLPTTPAALWRVRRWPPTGRWACSRRRRAGGGRPRRLW